MITNEEINNHINNITLPLMDKIKQKNMKIFITIALLLITGIAVGQTKITIHPGTNNNGSTSGTTVYLSENSILSDADLTLGSSTFGTDQTTAIQTILNTASSSHPLTVIWDVKVGISGDSIKSNTTIIASQGCGAILRDNSNRAVLSNYHATPGTLTDSNITIIGGIWNGNGYRGGVAKQSGAIASYGNVPGIRMNGVKNVILRDLTILNTRSWATNFFTTKNVLVSNVRVDQGSSYVINQDGVHFEGYADNIKVYGLSARCGDDALAFNCMSTVKDGLGNPNTFWVGKYGPQTNIDVRDLYLDSSYMGIRIMSGNMWADNINIENVTGKAINYWLVIDNYNGSPAGVTDPGPGNVGKVRIANISVTVTGNPPDYGLLSGKGNALVNCNVKKLIISNYTRNFQSTSTYYPALRIGGTNTVVDKVIVSGFSIDTSFYSTAKTSQIVVDSGAFVKSLNVVNSNVVNTHGLDSSSLIEVSRNATVTELILNGISNNGVSRILNDSATVNYISATNIRHTSSDTTIAPFYVKPALSVIDFVLSNFWGSSTITEGTFTAKRGDGF